MSLFSNKRKVELFINFFLLIIIGGIQVIYPLYLSQVIDATSPSEGALFYGVKVITVLLVSKLILMLLQTVFSSKARWGALSELRANLCEKLLYAEYSQIARENVGTITQTVESDTEQLVSFYTSFLGIVIKDSILLLGVCTMAFLISKPVGCFLCIASVLMFLWFYIINQRSKMVWKNTKEANAAFFNVFCEVFLGAKDYRLIKQSEFLENILDKSLQNFFCFDFISSYLSYRYWIASLATFGLSKVIVLFLGVFFMQFNAISIGTIYLFIYYLDMLSEPVEELRLQLEDIPAIRAAENRICAILELKPSMTYGDDCLNQSIRSIDIKSISFSYDEKKVFNAFSELFTEGNVYALVGPSGIGKSTLLNLIVRLYDCTAGSIDINGISIIKYKKGEIAKHVCYLREIEVSSLKISEYFAQISADDPEFNKHYYNLFATRIVDWEKGLSELSRGEKQSLALMQALITNKSLILLDEIFDAIDAKNITYAIDCMKKQEKTVIVITHEQEVIDKCDQIVVLG